MSGPQDLAASVEERLAAECHSNIVQARTLLANAEPF
jgi:hypothetical protein